MAFEVIYVCVWIQDSDTHYEINTLTVPKNQAHWKLSSR